MHYRERLQVCLQCPQQSHRYCHRFAHPYPGLARRKEATCPKHRHKNRGAPDIPDHLDVDVSELAIVCVHFNPCAYEKPRSNNQAFRSALGELSHRVWSAELSFDGEFHTNPTFSLQGDRANLCWQKEAMINLVIRQLPPHIQYVAWIDQDLIFDNPRWAEQAVYLLQNGHCAVQLFRSMRLTDAAGKIARTIPGNAAKAAAGDAYGGAPGFAWAARRDFLERVGYLVDNNIVGGGDQLFAAAVLNQQPRHLHRHPPAIMHHNMDWWQRVRADMTHHRLQASYVPGSPIHLFHGERKDRQYVERQQLIQDLKSEEVLRNENGLIICPERLRKPIAGFFARRQDDG